jgi:hypothetical protein
VRRGGPDVLVPRGQDDALLLFVARMQRDGVPPPPSLAAPAGRATGLEAPAPLDVAPLDAQPLSAPTEPLERSDT